jgi:hypothetical protein
MDGLRGFAPIGILEEWNIGIMGLFFRPIIPSFQHSIIPIH